MGSYGAWSGAARSTANLPDTALKLYQIKSNEAARQSQQALTEKELGLKERQLGMQEKQSAADYGPGGFKQQDINLRTRAADIGQGNLDLETKKLQQSTDIATTPFGAGDISRLRNSVVTIDKQFKTSLNAATTPLFNDILQRTEAGQKRSDIYVDLKAGWKDNYSKPITEQLSKDLQKAMMEGDTNRADTITALMNRVEKPEFLDSMFTHSARYVKNQQDLINAEIAQKTRKTPEKPTVIPAGSTAIDKDGKVILSVPPKPERPIAVPAGGTLVDPTSGKVVATGPPKAGKDMTTENRMTAKDVSAAEEKILTNPDNPATQGQVDFFNQYSTKPYMYELETTEGKIYGTNTKSKKIDLPKVNGKQVTAADVYNTAQENGVTVREVLKRIGVK